jgi:hypothetical protein
MQETIRFSRKARPMIHRCITDYIRVLGGIIVEQTLAHDNIQSILDDNSHSHHEHIHKYGSRLMHTVHTVTQIHMLLAIPVFHLFTRNTILGPQHFNRRRYQALKHPQSRHIGHLQHRLINHSQDPLDHRPSHPLHCPHNVPLDHTINHRPRMHYNHQEAHTFRLITSSHTFSDVEAACTELFFYGVL